MTGHATLTDGSLTFPIAGGYVTVFERGQVSPYVTGKVQHEGSGLSLSAGGTTVELTNLNVDPGVSRVYGDVTVNGEVAATSAYLFKLDGSTLKPLQAQGNKAILQGTEVRISDIAAPLIDDTFGTDAVKAGLLVGIATVIININKGAGFALAVRFPDSRCPQVLGVAAKGPGRCSTRRPIPAQGPPART